MYKKITHNHSLSKKLTSLTLAAMMAMSLGVSAFASDSGDDEVDYVQERHDAAVVRIVAEIKEAKRNTADGETATIKLSDAELKNIPWMIIDGVAGEAIDIEVITKANGTCTISGQSVNKTQPNKVFMTFEDFVADAAN